MAEPIVTFCGTNKLIKVSGTPCVIVCICAQVHLYSHWKKAIIGGQGSGACSTIPCGVVYSGPCMNIITRSDTCGDWFVDGFRINGELVIANSERTCNDGTYTITNLTSTVMTVCVCACLAGSPCVSSPDNTGQFTQDGLLSAGYLNAFDTTGGDPISGSQNLSGYYFLTNGWRVQPVCAPCACKSYLVEGNLFVCGGGVHPFVNTCLPLNTFVTINTSAQSLITTVCGCGGCPSAIADAVWNESLAGHTTDGTFGGVFGKIFNKVKLILTLLFTK